MISSRATSQQRERFDQMRIINMKYCRRVSGPLTTTAKRNKKK